MKNIVFTILVIIVFISLNNQLYCQNEKSVFFAEINFQLGQNKEEVISKIDLKKYKLIDDGNQYYRIVKYDSQTGKYIPLGNFSFRNGKLSYASSHWVSTSSKEIYNSFESLFGIMKNVFGEGYSTGEIYISNSETSEVKIKRIDIVLGEKSVIIFVSYFKENSQESIDIFENIKSK